jgi:hypothetical protein
MLPSSLDPEEMLPSSLDPEEIFIISAFYSRRFHTNND